MSTSTADSDLNDDGHETDAPQSEPTDAAPEGSKTGNGKKGLKGLAIKKPSPDQGKKDRPKPPTEQADEDAFRRDLFLRSRKKKRDPLTLKKIIRAAFRGVVYLAPWVAALLMPLASAQTGTPYGQTVIQFYKGHLPALLVILVPVAMTLGYIGRNYNRTHPQAAKGKPRPVPQPAWPKANQRNKDIADIIANLDHIVMRIAYVVFFAAAIATPLLFPVSVDDLSAVTAENTEPVRQFLLGAAGPAALYGTIHLRTVAINKARQDAIGALYAIARDTLKYPKLSATMMRNGTPRQKMLLAPWQAIDVKRWASLEDPDVVFVNAPEELSVEDVKMWDEFNANLNAKMPREEEWRVERDRRGRGATVGPANYPRGILWDGEIEPDPLAFRLGQNLENGEIQYITFSETSPHIAISGGTSTGKTSGAEIIAAQVLIKPMPWDQNLYGQVHLIDPKGPLANRWAGRPGVVASNGRDDTEVEDVEVIDEESGESYRRTGILVMAEHMRYLVDEHERRQSVLGNYRKVATWVDLPDDVKRAERFAPLFIICDEFLDHTAKANGRTLQVKMENEAREYIVEKVDYLLRKSRNVGFHIAIIAQRANMSLIGDTIMTNLPVRMVTGQIDKPQLGTMFAVEPSQVPSLPSTVPGTTPPKPIPGRARVMNALGQAINKVQIMWFGGSTNSQTLDKWLPQGDAPLNGDFNPPPGRPRRPGDFDEEGNLIAAHDEETTGPGVDVVEAENEAIETNQGAQDGQEHHVDPFDEDGPAPTLAGVPAGDDIFPASVREVPRCPAKGCVNDADSQCSTCGTAYCGYHLSPNPDPEKTGLLCPEHLDAHPLTESGLGVVYQQVHEMATAAGLAIRYRTEPSIEVGQGQVVKAIIRNPDRKVVAALDGHDGTIHVKTKSGEGYGPEAVLGRVEMAVNAHLERMKAEQAQGTLDGAEDGER